MPFYLWLIGQKSCFACIPMGTNSSNISEDISILTSLSEVNDHSWQGLFSHTNHLTLIPFSRSQSLATQFFLYVPLILIWNKVTVTYFFHYNQCIQVHICIDQFVWDEWSFLTRPFVTEKPFDLDPFSMSQFCPTLFFLFALVILNWI